MTSSVGLGGPLRSRRGIWGRVRVSFSLNSEPRRHVLIAASSSPRPRRHVPAPLVATSPRSSSPRPGAPRRQTRPGALEPNPRPSPSSPSSPSPLPPCILLPSAYPEDVKQKRRHAPLPLRPVLRAHRFHLGPAGTPNFGPQLRPTWSPLLPRERSGGAPGRGRSRLKAAATVTASHGCPALSAGCTTAAPTTPVAAALAA